MPKIIFVIQSPSAQAYLKIIASEKDWKSRESGNVYRAVAELQN